MKRYCRYKGVMCEFATEYGYCQLTSCVQYRIFVQNMSDANRQTILNLPSAQPEQKRGHWIYKKDEFDGLLAECSVCHVEGMLYGNFCPNCGAKMDEEESELAW